MLKKTLAVLMAAILALGIFSVGASAEDVEEPEYTPVTYTIEEIVAAVEAKKELTLNPTDIILLPEQEEEEEGGEEVESQADVSAVLIVEYLAGKGAASKNEFDKFVDYVKKGAASENESDKKVDYVESGYGVKALGERTNHSYKKGAFGDANTIDFEHESEYGFVQWKVTSAYSGPEFNRVTVEAVWDVPVLTGWAGYKTMIRGYIKTIIDYVVAYLADVFTRLGDFLV